MLEEQTWRGRCLRTWVWLAGVALLSLFQRDAQPWWFWALLPLLIVAAEAVYTLNSRSKRYNLEDICGNAGHRLGQAFRHRSN